MTVLILVSLVVLCNGIPQEPKRIDDNLIQRLELIIMNQNEKIANLERIVMIHEQRFDYFSEKYTNELNEVKAVLKPNVRYEHNAFGCLSDTIYLSCPDDSKLNITSAHYAQYHNPCSSNSCCAPSPGYDCALPVSEVRPIDWSYLLYLCQNQTNCTYEYDGSVIDECEEGYVADYMQIFYNCVPDNEDDDDEAVGFSVYATSTVEYDSNSIVMFNGIISNFGNHFNVDSSSFNCPVHGVYLFGLNLKNFHNGEVCVAIMRDDEDVGSVWTDQITSEFFYGQGSAIVVAKCSPGQSVWVRTTCSSYIYGGGAKYSHFTGYLMHRY